MTEDKGGAQIPEWITQEQKAAYGKENAQASHCDHHPPHGETKSEPTRDRRLLAILLAGSPACQLWLEPLGDLQVFRE